MEAKFFIVSNKGYILPVEYKGYEAACASCEPDETVYIADSLDVLECCLGLGEDLTGQSF